MGGELKILFINVQGLTKSKLLELQEFVDYRTILCLAETQHKFDKLNVREDLEKYICMRNLNSKKGGGIMVIKKKDTNIKVKNVFSIHEDCMIIECQVRGLKFKLVTTYFQSNDENDKIASQLKTFLEMNEDELVLVVGDFNAHIGILGERINKNGKLLEDLIEQSNLVNLNRTPECSGKITRNIREQKTTIDYALANRKMFGYYKKKKIDENKELFDLSDHCMIDLTLELEVEKLEEEKRTIEINCLQGEKLQNFNREVKQELEGMNNLEIKMEKIDRVMERAAQEHLKKKIVQGRRRKQKEKIEPIWMNKEIKTEIKKRKKLNRLKRNNLNPEIEEKFNKSYVKQKEKVKAIINEENKKHEKKITDDIKKDKSRKIWENINYLRGIEKHKSIRNDTYANDGRKLEEEEAKLEIKNFWKNIYQKTENNIQSTWENTRESYTNEVRNTTVTVDQYTFPHQLQEHMDYFLEITPENQYINPMNEPLITIK